MIRYALNCGQGHSFESWFQSGAAFESLMTSGHVTCPHCGDSNIEKALMTPRVSGGRTRSRQPTEDAGTDDEATPPEGARGDARMAALRRHVEANSDYVGANFAAEARRIHSGESDARMIHGEASVSDAKALIQDGVPVAPLPFVPRRKTN